MIPYSNTLFEALLQRLVEAEGKLRVKWLLSGHCKQGTAGAESLLAEEFEGESRPQDGLLGAVRRSRRKRSVRELENLVRWTDSGLFSLCTRVTSGLVAVVGARPGGRPRLRRWPWDVRERVVKARASTRKLVLPTLLT
jgi:hypothetical protein